MKSTARPRTLTAGASTARRFVRRVGELGRAERHERVRARHEGPVLERPRDHHLAAVLELVGDVAAVEDVDRLGGVLLVDDREGEALRALGEARRVLGRAGRDLAVEAVGLLR